MCPLQSTKEYTQHIQIYTEKAVNNIYNHKCFI